MMTHTTTAAAGEILAGHSMDYTMQIHYARRADGQWFTRCQSRHPRYGYRWGAWRPSSGPSGFTSSTGQIARLPKGGR